ncbi:CehA/McbA family metallohydrolase [Deinococcus metallilatus]|uniref:Polymerase/histidinol phosphatase N-terminal domain-containing protein n=1 Tax=Deinococcus metallilatus TaxID=1211322 RepID=A0ABR6MXI3_9DEIO|nr:CehA/McbA family metallohydrolase [Deinococcus metallilatus]MBB5295677.1 hypothetical protein [Deinococcus metallilatus]GMA14206.1 hypothetical protein GCM10025871_05370 [Deinococcus metallilatus]
MSALVVERHFSPEDARRDPYPALPFTVPPGTRGVTVQQSVTPGTATVDLGYADQFGVRGWSGGARREFTVTTSDATPGYTPGVFRPGEHQVLLGLYHVPPGGAQVTVRVELHPEGDLRWVRGDLHAHTFHSDAKGSPAQLAAAARDRGLAFVAVADHNTVSHHPHLGDALLLPAQEVTTYHGHFVAHGPGPQLEFRITDARGIRAALDAAARARLLTVLAHPVPTCPSCDWTWGLEDQFDALEVWNGPWLALNWIAREKWLGLLDRGVRLPAVGGSDRHQPDAWPDLGDPLVQVGSPTTWIKAAGTHRNDLYAGILAGRTCVSEAPGGPLIDLALQGDHLHYDVSGEPGGTLCVYAGREVICRVPFGGPLRGKLALARHPAPYYRAEVTALAPPEQARLARERWPQHVRPQDVAERVRALSGAVWP